MAKIRQQRNFMVGIIRLGGLVVIVFEAFVNN
jgi:hypothetical protein